MNCPTPIGFIEKDGDIFPSDVIDGTALFAPGGKNGLLQKE